MLISKKKKKQQPKNLSFMEKTNIGQKCILPLGCVMLKFNRNICLNMLITVAVIGGRRDYDTRTACHQECGKTGQC